jgi:MarR family transcriptional regulator, organic hydroperoxide resistance regulator
MYRGIAEMEKAELIKEILSIQQRIDRILNQFTPEPWIELNLTLAQLKSLLFIASKEKTNFKKLAEALGVTPPNITGIIDRLVEQDLVSRTENTEDRRVMLLQLTEKGRDLLNHLRENRFNITTQVLAHLSNDELSLQLKALNSVLRASEIHFRKTQE